MDSIMEPYVADLLADDITASMVEFLSGDGGAGQMDVGVLDAYLRAIGALPAHPAAPGADLASAAEVESMASNDDTNGVLYDWDTKVDAKVPCALLPPPPGFPPLPVPGLADEPVYAAPARRLPPPPGFTPLPVPAKAEPVYAAPADEGDAIRAFMQQLEWSELYNGDDDAPAPDDSTATRPQLCAPYDDDIDVNLRAMEKDAAERLSPDYLDMVHNGQISAASRASLVAWMGRLTHRYELAAGTLHRAVSYFDRFLSTRALPSYTAHQLSLVGATAVYTAAKYEDQGTVFKLDAREIASYGEFASAQEVLAMEREMMTALAYRLGDPNTETFDPVQQGEGRAARAAVGAPRRRPVAGELWLPGLPAVHGGGGGNLHREVDAEPAGRAAVELGAAGADGVQLSGHLQLRPHRAQHAVMSQ
uniref:Cyclin-like domain-containing protein n=1 Tax=Oryza meridionalis TaxID=40149 RepID=A0A0E0CN45_9ORYZ